MRDYFSEYLAYLRTERGLAETSISSYRGDLGKLQAWMNDTELELLLLTRSDLSEFVMTLSYDGLKASSIARVMAGVRGFYKFLVYDGHIKRDPTEFLGTPQRESYLPRFLNKAEIDLLLDAPDTETLEGLRDRAILALFYASGLRVSELTALTNQATDLDRSLVTVTGKGNKQRKVPFNHTTGKRITDYRQLRGLGSDNASLFTEKNRQMNRQEVWELVRRHATSVGLEDVSPHTLRHTFATHLMQIGKADIRFVQQMLGHAKITTTQVYTHITSDSLKASYLKFHPRAI